jgi:hypothetical protein
MKKVIFMLGAVLTFGIASAQTEPATTKKETTQTTTVAKEKQKNKKDAGKVQPATTAPGDKPDGTRETLLMDQDVSKDHTKVTPIHANTADTVAVKKTATSKQKTKKS